MAKTKKSPLIEMTKEGLRIAFLAALAALVSWGATELANLDPNSVYAIVGTILLKLADKYVHVSDNKLKGISPV